MSYTIKIRGAVKPFSPTDRYQVYFNGQPILTEDHGYLQLELNKNNKHRLAFTVDEHTVLSLLAAQSRIEVRLVHGDETRSIHLSETNFDGEKTSFITGHGDEALHVSIRYSSDSQAPVCSQAEFADSGLFGRNKRRREKRISNGGAFFEGKVYGPGAHRAKGRKFWITGGRVYLNNEAYDAAVRATYETPSQASAPASQGYAQSGGSAAFEASGADFDPSHASYTISGCGACGGPAHKHVCSKTTASSGAEAVPTSGMPHGGRGHGGGVRVHGGGGGIHRGPGRHGGYHGGVHHPYYWRHHRPAFWRGGRYYEPGWWYNNYYYPTYDAYLAASGGLGLGLGVGIGGGVGLGLGIGLGAGIY